MPHAPPPATPDAPGALRVATDVDTLALDLPRANALHSALSAILRAGDAAALTAGLSAMAATHFATGGKQLRARLALAAASALGVPAAWAMPWAVACEVLHNATLVHDDLQDGDTTRRGAPTVWVTHGAAQAINVGDWLFMRALAAVDEASALPSELRLALCRALRRGLETVIVGQSRECGFRGGDIVTPSAYAHMVREKTAALFCLPVFGAALMAGYSLAQAAQATEAFGAVGELFQWVDDVIDLYGDKGRDAPGQDLYEGKMSALAVTHAARVPEDASWLADLLRTARSATTPAQILRARQRFLQAGTLREVMSRIAGLAAPPDFRAAPALAPVHAALLAAIRLPLSRLHADAERALHVD